jgi:hypothetical protein
MCLPSRCLAMGIHVTILSRRISSTGNVLKNNSHIPPNNLYATSPTTFPPFHVLFYYSLLPLFLILTSYASKGYVICNICCYCLYDRLPFLLRLYRYMSHSFLVLCYEYIAFCTVPLDLLACFHFYRTLNAVYSGTFCTTATNIRELSVLSGEGDVL